MCWILGCSDDQSINHPGFCSLVDLLQKLGRGVVRPRQRWEPQMVFFFTSERT